MKAAEPKSASISTIQKKSNIPFFDTDQASEKESPFFAPQEASGTDAFFQPATPPIIQTKLTVGQPNDKYEQEADSVADKVVQRLSKSDNANHQSTPSVSEASTPIIQHKTDAPEEEKLDRQEDNQKELPELQRMPVSSIGDDEGVQMKCAACGGEEHEHVQKKGIVIARKEATEGVASNDIESQLNSSKGGGSPLPDNTRTSMESAMGADFSNVRVHTGSNAVQMSQDLNAQAFTHGSDVYFNEGKYSPSGTEGGRLLAHELVHTVQQGGTKSKISTSREKGGKRTETGVQVNYNTNNAVIQRGEAGVHKGIEMEAKGLADPGQGKLSPEQKDAYRIYVGNWMRDFSQAFVPTVVKGVAENVPKSLTDKNQKDTIGMGGAMQLLTGVLRALAILEFGKEIVDPVVNARNLGVYKPEGHIDNPMGMPAEDFVVTPRDSDGKVKNPEVIKDAANPAFQTAMKGAGVQGAQVENSELYKASSSGLSGHIYNSIESAKRRFLYAVAWGKTPQGMAEYGAGAHAIEDYFSHSNFIEIALNIEITNAMRQKRRGKEGGLSSDLLGKIGKPSVSGNYVDPLFDKTVGKGKDKRSVVTTGTFGSQDTKVSLAHVVVPQLPKLAEKINEGVDKMLALVLSEGGDSLWEKIQKKAKEDNSVAAMWEVVGGMDAAGMTSSSTEIETDERYVNLPTLTWPPYTRYDMSIPTGVKQTEELGMLTAVRTAVSSIETLKRMNKQVEKLREYFSILPAWVKDLIPDIKKMIAQIIEQLRQRIRHAVNTLLVQAIESMTGVNLPEEKRQDLHKAANYVKGEVEEMATSTSLTSRLANPDDPLTKLRNSSDPNDKAKYKRMMAAEGESLPPSHSELSKDHPPHQAPDGAPGHKMDEGSPFYELHKRLAVHSIKHLDILMANAWHTKSLVGDNWKQGLSDEELKAANQEATNAGNREKGLQNKKKNKGRSLLQNNFEAILKNNPNAKLILDAVDLYISHPEDSNWWQPIVRTYVNNNESKVLEDIQIRNKTRKARK